MITVLKQIKGHDKVESLQIMLEVIEVLEKNYFNDETINNEEYNIVIEWLEKYYCELKILYSIHRGLEQK